jgi:hypothetical protein
LHILYSGRDSATAINAASTSPSEKRATTTCYIISEYKSVDHLKLNGITCHQKRRPQRVPMRQIYEENSDVLEGKSENYHCNKPEELPPLPPPPPPPPMPPETRGRFNKTALSISKKKRDELLPLPEQYEEHRDNRMMDEVLLRTAGTVRFQSRFHSWPKSAQHLSPLQKNYCRRCCGEAPRRRLSAPVPICVTYYTRVRLRSFSHILAGVSTPRRRHADACVQVSTCKKRL